jgi:hypothetical protein
MHNRQDKNRNKSQAICITLYHVEARGTPHYDVSSGWRLDDCVEYNKKDIFTGENDDCKNQEDL